MSERCRRCLTHLGGFGEAEDNEMCVSCYCEDMEMTEEEYWDEDRK